jgi:uncharacterized RDD family membrane protein YckC
MTNATTLDARDLAYDPAVHPELYNGVRTRRMFAFLIDATVVFFLMVVAYIVLGILGFFTLFLTWLLIPAVWPFIAILYSVLTVGGPSSATPGMRFSGIELRTTRGQPMDYGLALLHAVGFWFSVAILTPLVLLVGLFTPRKQLLHDLVLGVAAVRSPAY